jgi:hypothetical protein
MAVKGCEMNKPTTPNKFVTDLWSMTQMLIDEAVLVEREACAKMVDHILKEGGGTWGDAIRARGEQA